MARTYRRKATVPQFDPLPSLEQAVSLLNKAKVKYALIGGIALWEYVSPDLRRYTGDVDFAVPHNAISRLGKAIIASGFRARSLPIGGLAIRQRGIVVDFVDRHPELDWLFEDAIEAAHKNGPVISVGACEIPVVPKGYLIALKLATGERKDEGDVRSLLFTVSKREYYRLRRLIREVFGPDGALRLDALARMIRHPAVAGGHYRFPG